MATHQHERNGLLCAGNGQSPTWAGGHLAIDFLHLCERPSQRSSAAGPDWTEIPEGVLLHVGRFLDPYTVSNARSSCKSWRRAFSLNVRAAQLEIVEHRAAQARAFLRAFLRAYPSTTELVLDVTFRRTAREKIQAALEEHFQALHDFGLQALQLNLDLNSFNERKIKLPDVSLLASWVGLTRLTLQESGWRSQQLRVDAGSVFSALPGLQELSVVCKYSGAVKAKWWRPPSSAERLAARMPTWPPGPGGPGGSHAAAAAAAGAAGGAAVGASGGTYGWPYGGPRDSPMEDAIGAQQQQQQQASPQLLEQQLQQLQQQSHQQQQQQGALPRPVLTQHLRCQMTQNQSMSGELAKALRRITPALQPHVSALTFEIVEETYAEPSRCTTPLELSALPGLKSLTLLSGAEDALAHSRLDIVGAAALESLVIFDLACGCWCYKKPGHGIPPRLLSAPPACLRSLTVVGFVVNQCQNLHALASLTCLEELRLEQPDPDSLAAVAGDLLLSWLPPSLRVLKLHSVVLPPCGGLVDPPPEAATAAAVTVAAVAAATSPSLHLKTPQQLYGGGSSSGVGGGSATAGRSPAPLVALSTAAAVADAAAGGGGSGTGSGGAVQLLYGVAPAAPLPHLRELYLSKCKVPTLGVLGVCPHLTALGVINCLSSSGMLPVPAAMPTLRSLAVVHTLAAEQELGTTCGAVGAVGTGPPNMMPPNVVCGGGGAAAGGAGDGTMAPGGLAAPGSAHALHPPAGPATTASAAGLRPAPGLAGPGGAVVAGAGAALPPHSLGMSAAAAAAASGPLLHVSGLPLPPVVWGSDEQVAAAAGCRSVASLELILPRGTAGFSAVAALARMEALTELDVCLPCGLSECMLGLAALGRADGGRLRRLTMWVDSRTCVNRSRSRQLQAIQRNLQAHMPHTLVEWAGAESRHSSWTGLEARVFNPH